MAIRTWQVWSEGYAVTGGHGVAQLVGSAEAETFSEACVKVCSDLKESDWGRFDPERLTLWGCHLFPTEAEARRSYG